MAETFPALDEVFCRRAQIPLDEVSDLTSFPLKPLLADCRAGRIDHQWLRGKYYMTRTQIEKLLATATRKARPGAAPRSVRGQSSSAVDVEKWKARKRDQLAKRAG